MRRPAAASFSRSVSGRVYPGNRPVSTRYATQTLCSASIGEHPMIRHDPVSSRFVPDITTTGRPQRRAHSLSAWSLGRACCVPVWCNKEAEASLVAGRSAAHGPCREPHPSPVSGGGVVARIVTGPHDAHRQDPHLPMRYDTGRPRAVIRFRISQPRTTSLPCPAGLRARRPAPMMDV